MRITAELLGQVEQRVNPNGERELVLRNLGIPAIENLSIARDEFDAWDLCNNRIAALENFPRAPRLSNLLCAGNTIEAIDADNLQKNIPNVTCLTLSYNNISSLAEVAKLGKGLPKLEFLALIGNPVIGRQHYRLYTIHCIPSLRVLDFSKIKLDERERARRLASSAAGAALESDVQAERSSVKTFVPGESEDGKSFAASFTSEQKELIRELLANAESAKEIDDIENAVRRGVVPTQLKRNMAEAGLSEIENQPEAKRSKA